MCIQRPYEIVSSIHLAQLALVAWSHVALASPPPPPIAWKPHSLLDFRSRLPPEFRSIRNLSPKSHHARSRSRSRSVAGCVYILPPGCPSLYPDHSHDRFHVALAPSSWRSLYLIGIALLVSPPTPLRTMSPSA